MGRRGAPPKKSDVLNAAQNIVKRDLLVTPFKDGRPSETWFKVFIYYI
jgi:hypothetical protein